MSTNFVEDLVDKPTAEGSPTEHLERWEAAILLEAARRLHPMTRPGLPIYPLLAWELLTGCIESETKSREVADVRLPGDYEFPDGVVMVRPNGSQERLRTEYRTRYLQLQPQLAEVLQEYLTRPQAPQGRLLFPAGSRDTPIGDWRRILDEIARAAGFSEGEVRCIRFRPTFATHRAYTCDETGQPMTALKLAGEMGHGSLKMLEERYFKAARLPAVPSAPGVSLERMGGDPSGTSGRRARGRAHLRPEQPPPRPFVGDANLLRVVREGGPAGRNLLLPEGEAGGS